MTSMRIFLSNALLCLLLPACGELPDPTHLLTTARVVGLVSSVEGAPSRTAPRPGETTNLRVLVVHSNTPIPNTYAFVVCRSIPSPLGVATCTLDAPPVAVFSRTVLSFDSPDLSVQIPENTTDDLLLVGAVCFGGQVRGDLTNMMGVGAESLNPCEGEGEGQILTGTIIVHTSDAEENHIPVIQEIRFDSNLWAAGIPEERTGCAGMGLPMVSIANIAPHTIEVIPAAGAREAFENPQTDPVSVAIENLPVAFYSTGRGLDKLYSVIDAEPDDTAPGATAIASAEYSPEATENETDPDGHIVRFEIIMRDGRGGVSHEARALCLLP